MARVIKMSLFSNRNVKGHMFSLFLGIFTGFLIFNQNGWLAIKNTDDGTVYHTEFRTSLLPQYDQKLLEKGIYCETPSDVARVLENFNS